MADVKLFGFGEVSRFVQGLKGNIQKAAENTLHIAGMEAAKRAKFYIVNQEGELGKNPKKKVRKKRSDKTLVDTSTYLQSITSHVDRVKMVAYAGVKRTSTHPNGDTIANIAQIHEYGAKARNIPARPVWGPVFQTMKTWLKESNTFYNELKKGMR